MAKKTTAGAKGEPISDITSAAKPRARRTTKRATAMDTANDTNVAVVEYEATVVSPAGIPALAGSPSDDDIRVRAYHRWLQRGGHDGMDFDDWVEAEKELRQRK